MLRSSMITMARQLISDVDTVNPFTSDATFDGYIDDASIDLAVYLGWPKQTQTISLAIADGPDGNGNIVNAKNLSQDCLLILAVFIEDSVSKQVFRLKPKWENEIQSQLPNWRFVGQQSIPSYYVILNGVTEGTTNWPQMTLTVDRAMPTAQTMRIHYVQSPAASTTNTNSTVFPPQYHKALVYYIAAQALEPRNAQKAEYFFKKYETERKRQKALSSVNWDPVTEIWDLVQVNQQIILPYIAR